MSSSTLSLNKLPPEILLKILEELPLPDVINCLQVSKSINGFVQNHRHLLTRSIVGAIFITKSAKDNNTDSPEHLKIALLKNQSMAWGRNFVKVDEETGESSHFPLANFCDLDNWLPANQCTESTLLQHRTTSLDDCLEEYADFVFSRILGSEYIELRNLHPSEIAIILRKAQEYKIGCYRLGLTLHRPISTQLADFVIQTKPIHLRLTYAKNWFLDCEGFRKIMNLNVPKVEAELIPSQADDVVGRPIILPDEVLLKWKGVIFDCAKSAPVQISNKCVQALIQQWYTGERKDLLVAVALSKPFTLTELLSSFVTRSIENETEILYVVRPSDGKELSVLWCVEKQAVLVGFAVNIVPGNGVEQNMEPMPEVEQVEDARTRRVERIEKILHHAVFWTFIGAAIWLARRSR